MRTRKSLILLLMAAVLLIGLGSAHASSPEPNWADSYTLPVFFRSYTSGHYSINVDFGSFLWDDEMLAENNASDLSALQSFTDYTFEWVGYDELQNVVGNSLYLNANPGNLPRFDGGTRDAAIEDLVGKVVATLNVTKGTEPVTSVNIKLADIMDAPTVNQDGAVTQYVHFTPGESVTLTIANPPTIAEGATMKYLWTYQNPTTHQTEYVETDVPSLTLENLTAEYDNVAVFWYAANVDYVGGLAYDQWYKVSEYGQSSYTLYDKTLGRVQMPFYNRINENIKLYPNDSYTMKVPASTSGNPDKKMVYRWDVLDPDTLTTTYQYTTEPELTITNTYPAGTDMGCGVAVGYEGDSEFDFLIYDCYFNFSMKDKPNLKEYYTFPIYLEKYITESGNDYCTLSINTYNEVLGGSWTLPVDEKIAQELNDNFFTLDITKFTYRWELAPAAQEVFGENFEGRTIVSNKNNLPICTSEAVYTADLEDKLINKPFISLVITDGSTAITTFDFMVEDFIDCVDVDNEKSPNYKYVKFVPGETITLTVSDKVYDPNNDLVYNWGIDKRGTLQSGKGKTVTFTPTEEYDQAILSWNVRSAQAEELFGTRGGDFSTPVLPGYMLQSVNSLDVQVPETDRSYYEVTLYEGESFTFKMPEAKPAAGCEDKKLVYQWYRFRIYGSDADDMTITSDKPELTVTNDGSFVGDYQYDLSVGYEGEPESFRDYPTYFGVEMKDGVNVLKIEEKTVSQVEETLSSAILQQHGAAIETPAQMKNLMLTVLENAVTTELSDKDDGSIGNQLVNIDVNIIDLNTGADRPATAEDYAAEGGIYTMIPWVNGVPRYVENCEYIVTHLFETDSLNHKAGDIEVLTPLKVDERGLHVMLTGASPMMVTWVMPDATLTPPEANDPIPTPAPSQPENAYGLEDSYTFPLYVQKYDRQTAEDDCEFTINILNTLNDTNGFGLSEEVMRELRTVFFGNTTANFQYQWVFSDEAKVVFSSNATTSTSSFNGKDLPNISTWGAYTAAVEQTLLGKTVISLVITDGTQAVTTFHFQAKDFILCPELAYDGPHLKYIYFTPGETITLSPEGTAYAGGKDITYVWTSYLPTGTQYFTGDTYTFVATEDHNNEPVSYSAYVTEELERLTDKQARALGVGGSPIYRMQLADSDQVRVPEMDRGLVNVSLYKNESYTLEMPAATGAEGKELVYRWTRTVLVGDDMGNNMVETSVPSLTITNDVEKASKYQYNLQAGYKGEEDSFRSYPSYYVVEMLDEIKYIDVKDPEPITKVETELMNSILEQHGVTIATPAQLQELMLTVLENDQLVDLTATTDGSVGSTLVDVEVVIVDAVTGAERPATPEDFAELGKVTVIIPWPNGVPQNAGDYDYFITHMFETDGNGHKAGEIEILIPFRVDERGLYVTLTGASPMLVTWVKSNAQLNPIDPTVPTNPTVPTQPTPSAPPATGDSSPIALWLMLMALSAIVVAMQLRKRKA